MSGFELRDRSDGRFQRHTSARGTGAERVLAKRLPVAGTNLCAHKSTHGVPTLVSEIDVHR